MRGQRLYLPDFPDPRVARTLSPNGRAHWSLKSRARQQVSEAVTAWAKFQKLQPMQGPVRITYCWTFPEARKRDLDNLATGVAKAATDVLVRLGIIEADDATLVSYGAPTVTVEKGQRSLTIVLEPAQAAGTEAA